jgi:hypothetical protein
MVDQPLAQGCLHGPPAVAGACAPLARVQRDLWLYRAGA